MRNLLNNWQELAMPIIAIGLGIFIMTVMLNAVSQF